MTDKTIVKRHIRHRGGRTGRIAAILGIDPIVNVEPYTRRRRPFWEVHGWSGTAGEGYVKNFPRGLIARVAPPEKGGPRFLWYWSVVDSQNNIKGGYSSTALDAMEAVEAFVSKRSEA